VQYFDRDAASHKLEISEGQQVKKETGFYEFPTDITTILHQLL
jgi:hypothetical protein